MSQRPSPPSRNTPPAIQKLRVRYAKRGRMRFASHRDFQRALERALRRAGVPMAYSAGFSPHPKISYAGAAPTGAASEAEYVELGVTTRLEPRAVRDLLDAALPDGLDILEVVEARGDSALSDRLEASLWEIEFPAEVAGQLEAAAQAFLTQEAVQVDRLTKSGRRTFDIRPAILRMTVPETNAPNGEVSAPGSGGSRGCGPPCAILQVVVRHGTPAVRPDDVLAGLRLASGLELQPLRATRRAQGPWDEVSGTVGDPLAPDRDAAVTAL